MYLAAGPAGVKAPFVPPETTILDASSICTGLEKSIVKTTGLVLVGLAGGVTIQPGTPSKLTFKRVSPPPPTSVLAAISMK